jgi:hypothetical protein
MSAQTSPPTMIHETETSEYGTYTGTWASNGQNYGASWNNLAAATITVRRFDPSSVEIYREDLPNTTSSGLTAIYKGQISESGNSIVNGTVTWNWPGRRGYPASGTWTAEWIRILWNGKDITNTTQSAVAGQQIALTASLPPGATLAKQLWSPWSVEGLTVGGFKIAPLVLFPRAGSPIKADFIRDSTSFYWIAPGYFQVTLSATVSNSQPILAKAAFNIDGPALPKVIAETGHVAIEDGPVLSFGNAEPGMAFKASAEVPTAVNGTFVWIQLINKDVVVLITQNGSSKTCNVAVETALDNTFPYAYGDSTSDSPDWSFDSTDTRMTRTFTARMYLLWNPALPSGCTLPDTDLGQEGTCTSIPVPLGYVDWEFNGGAQAKPSGKWTPFGPECSKGCSSAFRPSTEYPLWTHYISNVNLDLVACK